MWSNYNDVSAVYAVACVRLSLSIHHKPEFA